MEFLLGDPSKARKELGWQAKMSFHELVAHMIDADYRQQEREQYLKKGGYRIKNYYE